MSVKKIGILGTGDVGNALANGYVRHGYDVMLSAREAGNAKVTEWVAKHNVPNARGGSFTDAAKFGDIVILAVNGNVWESAIQTAGPANFDGKIVIDATNPIKTEAGFGPILNPQGPDNSLGEKVQAALPKARVVKAYNFINNKYFIDPVAINGQKPTFFLAGSDADAKKAVTELVTATGWDDVMDCGDIRASRMLEPLALLWVKLALRSGTGFDTDCGWKFIRTNK